MKNAIQINGTLYKSEAMHGQTPVKMLGVYGEDVLIEVNGTKDVQLISQLTLTPFAPEFPFYVKDADGYEMAALLTSSGGFVEAKNLSMSYGVHRYASGITSHYYDGFLEGKYELTTKEEFERIYNEAQKRVDADVYGVIPANTMSEAEAYDKSLPTNRIVKQVA